MVTVPVDPIGSRELPLVHAVLGAWFFEDLSSLLLFTPRDLVLDSDGLQEVAVLPEEGVPDGAAVALPYRQRGVVRHRRHGGAQGACRGTHRNADIETQTATNSGNTNMSTNLFEDECLRIRSIDPCL